MGKLLRFTNELGPILSKFNEGVTNIPTTM